MPPNAHIQILQCTHHVQPSCFHALCAPKKYDMKPRQSKDCLHNFIDKNVHHGPKFGFLEIPMEDSIEGIRTVVYKYVYIYMYIHALACMLHDAFHFQSRFIRCRAGFQKPAAAQVERWLCTCAS